MWCMGFVVCLFACSSAVEVCLSCKKCNQLLLALSFQKKKLNKREIDLPEILKFSSVTATKQQKQLQKHDAQHQCLFIHNNLRQNDTNIPIHLLPSSAVYFVFTFSISFASITTNETSHTHISTFGINSISTNGTTSRI